MRISDWSSDVCSSDLAASEPVDVDRMQADVAQTLDLMQQHALIDSQDSADMGEAFAKDLQPLQDETLQRTTESARRCRGDGPAHARQCLAATSAGADPPSPATTPSHHAQGAGPPDARPS